VHTSPERGHMPKNSNGDSNVLVGESAWYYLVFILLLWCWFFLWSDSESLLLGACIDLPCFASLGHQVLAGGYVSFLLLLSIDSSAINYNLDLTFNFAYFYFYSYYSSSSLHFHSWSQRPGCCWHKGATHQQFH